METLGQRILFIRNAMGLTQEQFAAAVSGRLKETAGDGQTETVTRGAIANWEKEKGIATRNVDAIVDLAGLSYDWLRKGRGTPPDAAELAVVGSRFKPTPPSNLISLDDRRNFREVIPLFGTVAAAMLGRGAFLLSQEPIDQVPMMPGIAGEKGVYALIVSGDSMWPMFSDRDIIYASTSRQPHKNDAVVVQEHDSANGQPQGFVKLFDHETASRLYTRQFNPESELIFEKQRGIQRHRVFNRRELSGL